MGQSGVPLNVSRDEIIEAMKACHGNMVRVARYLGCSHEAIYTRMRSDPELKAELAKAREAFVESLCDKAEDVLIYALEQREDLTNAMKSAMYSLNNQGKQRGYSPLTESITDELIKKASAQADRVVEHLSSLKKTPAKSEEKDDRNETQG